MVVTDALGLPVALGPGDSGFIAPSADGSLLSAFDGFGARLADLWRGPDASATTAAWSPDSSMIIVAGAPGGTLRAAIFPTDTWVAVDLSGGPLGRATGPLGLRWTPNGERFALASSLGVHVFSRSGELMWGSTMDGIRGNVRWSPDGTYLHVYASTPGVDG